MRELRGPVTALLTVILVAAVVAVGALDSPRPTAARGDRLGPESGEPVAHYLDRAQRSLDEESAARYALVSLDTEVSPADALQLTAGTRIAEVIFRVPIPRVQTPIVAVPVPDGAEAVLRAEGIAATRTTTGGSTARAAQVAAVSSARLAGGCACVVALLVRGETTALQQIGTRPGVRAVEALPADAVYGRLGVSLLLPEQDGIVAPGPDDGAVPPA